MEWLLHFFVLFFGFFRSKNWNCEFGYDWIERYVHSIKRDPAFTNACLKHFTYSFSYERTDVEMLLEYEIDYFKENNSILFLEEKRSKYISIKKIENVYQFISLSYFFLSYADHNSV